MLKFNVITRGNYDAMFRDKEAMIAISQFLNKEMICAVGSYEDEERKIYIPFHAITETICTQEGQNVNPVDVLCVGPDSACDGVYFFLLNGGQSITLTPGQTLEIASGQQYVLAALDTPDPTMADDPLYIECVYTGDAIDMSVMEEGTGSIVMFGPNDEYTNLGALDITAPGGCKATFPISITEPF